MRAGSVAGVYGGATLGLRPAAQSLVNDGNNAFVQDAVGVVYDAADGVQPYGAVRVQAPAVAGMIAYAPAPVLANTAILNGANASYTLTALLLSSDDRVDVATSVASAFSCAATEPAGAAAQAALFALDGAACTVTLSEAHGQPGLHAAT
eukprot:1324709-Prymnesium_polylepis.1